MTSFVQLIMPAQTLVHLPFKEDLRTYQFPTFSSEKRPEVAPSEAQLIAARRLVQGVTLSQGARHATMTACALGLLHCDGI